MTDLALAELAKARQEILDALAEVMRGLQAGRFAQILMHGSGGNPNELAAEIADLEAEEKRLRAALWEIEDAFARLPAQGSVQ